MQKKFITLVLSGLLITTMHPVMAENQPSLTSEQISHEKQIADLRKQKEILELKHSQAKLLRECHDLGIDCRGGSLEIKESFNDELSAEIESFNLPPAQEETVQSPFALNEIEASTFPSPVLNAIQNDSAQFKFSGNTHWALVGDKVGEWVVTHIDATKVRIKNARNSNTKTLLLSW